MNYSYNEARTRRDEERVNQEICSFTEFCNTLDKTADEAYEHICECCLDFEAPELYEIIKAFTLSVIEETIDHGKSIFRIAGGYLADGICTGITNSNNIEYDIGNNGYIDICDSIEESFANFKQLLEIALQSRRKFDEEFKKLSDFLFELESTKYGNSQGELYSSRIFDIVFNYVFFESESKSVVYKTFKDLYKKT